MSVPPQKISLSRSAGWRATIATGQDAHYRPQRRHLAGKRSRRGACTAEWSAARSLGHPTPGALHSGWRSIAADCPSPWVRGRYATGLWPCQWIRLPMSNARSI